MLVANCEARVVDPETGDDLGVGEDGELWIRGPNVMKGYLNNPDATAATIDGDGWLHTGDIGHVDADGYWFIVDRVKELIKVKGFQVPPAELEALLLTHPAVADVAVIGIPDEEAGERPKAFVVLKPGVDASRGRDPGVRGRARCALQAAVGGRVRRRDPEVTVGQDPPPAAPRP